MKKLNILASLCTGLLLLAACESDRDSNPTVKMPKEFVLYESANANNPISLEQSDKMFFSVKEQPDYGYTATVNYQVQVSLDDKWNDATADAKATYGSVEDISNTVDVEASAKGVAKAIGLLKGWKKAADVPEEVMDIYIRIKAYLSSLADQPCYSNSIKVKVYPCYVSETLPQVWYMVGTAVGSWTNNVGAEGKSLIPIALKKDAKYDATTGEGEFTYTGYFCGNELKFVKTPGQWAPLWGATYRPTEGDPDPASIAISTVGYYTVSFNSTTGSANAKIDVKAYEGDAPTVFTNWELVGDFNNWGGDGALVLTQNTSVKHIWYADVEFASDGEVLFRTDAAGTDKCGGDTFPYGLKTDNKIPVLAGKYRVVLNDIDRCYYFFEIKED